MIIKNGTDWNRHHGNGATLLENWVEERAIDPSLHFEDREKNYLKRAHKGILSEGKAFPMKTTSQESYTKKDDEIHKITIGKKRLQFETELLMRAVKDMEEKVENRTAKDWISTNHQDFAHSDIYGEIKDLGSVPPSEDDLEKYKVPITFWSENGKFGEKYNLEFDGTVKVPSLTFKKDTTFSTPIEENKKTSHK
ncbi:hypothetical protein HK099_005597 [Clydaea vesicula]|uniref:Uncharacterized protein n=1 Tax=Clydaea vesicula TaxID=447962 RepID=A0AAD5XYU7_9FUNG|nr:hypothetical protein HK099_005597 [Clydaea vesicula]KAJ3380119.1 hypothetical protein HDU92_006167 [Lobulomyces angularis]